MSFKSTFEKPIVVILVFAVIVPVVRFVFAAAPNPGHTWSELGDVAVTVIQGGTGLSTIAAGGILYASALDTLSLIAPTAANQVLRSTAANALEFAALVAADIPSLDVAKITTGIFGSARGGTGNGFTAFTGPTTSEKTFTLPNASSTILTSNAPVTVAQGGTGLSTLTTGNVILGAGASDPTFVAPGTSGNVLTSNGSTWTSQAASGGYPFFDITGPASSTKTFTFPNADATVLTTNALVTAAQGGTGASTLTGLLQGNGTSAITGITNSSTVGQLLRVTGTSTYGWGALNLADTDAITGLLPVTNGGAGAAPGSDDQVLIADSTSAATWKTINDCQGAGKALTYTQSTNTIGCNTITSSGSTLLDGSTHTDTVAGTVAYGDLIIGNATPKWDRLPKGAASQVLAVSGDGTTVGWSSYAPSQRPEFFYDSREIVIQKNGGVATMSTIGGVAPTFTTTLSNADAADGAWLQNTTSTTSGNPSGIVSAFTGVLRRDWDPKYFTRIKTDATTIANTRLWIGFFSASPDAIARGTGTISLIAFSYDTGVDGTAFWRTTTSAGVANTFTTTTTTIPIAANTIYDLKIQCDDTNICYFYINSELVATHSTNLPALSTNLGYANRIITLTTAARSIRTSYLSFRYKHNP